MLVYFGGLVECGCGFVVYLFDYYLEEVILKVIDVFLMIVILDVFEEINQGFGLEFVILVLGYVGWGSG